MTDQIKTTSGKTAMKRLEVLRKARPELRKQPRTDFRAEQVDALVQKMDALAEQSYRTYRTLREQLNVLRQIAVDAKQTAMEMRRHGKVDVEL